MMVVVTNAATTTANQHGQQRRFRITSQSCNVFAHSWFGYKT
jgi:hypothetical protein